MCSDQAKNQSPIDRDVLIRKQAEEREYLRGDKFRDTEPAGVGVAMAGRAYSDAEIVAELFKHHPPTSDQLPLYAAINQAAKNFAEIILANVPRGQDRNVALNCLRNVSMFANAAIALNGLSL